MPSAYSSTARLRTRSGCFECRRRRKKCDEQTPRCGGCFRNGLDCTWPTSTSQPVDGRRRRHQHKHLENQPKYTDHQSFQPYDHFDLYQHFATAVAPRLVRQNCLPDYSNQSHMLQLALEFPPLMGVMIAIAAMDVGMPRHDQLAMESYLFSLRSLQDRLAFSQDAGNEDGLLGTVVCLCVFENMRSDAPPNIGIHATIAGVLLTLRPPNQERDCPKTTIVFERICAESFLYHSTLMMLFDPSLDVLSGVNDLANLTRYFSDFPPESTEQKWLSMSTQPVLEASYQFFLVVADVTKLARIARPLNESETRTLIYLQKNILRWEEDTCGDPGKMLYVLAMRILLLKVDLALPNVNVTEEMQRLLQQGLDIIRSLDVRKFLLGYLLWPLAVLGTITVDDNDRNIVENKISLLAQTRHGQAVRAQRRLEAIWASRDGDKETTMLGRLRMLVEGI